jgi:hypothetical protein
VLLGDGKVTCADPIIITREKCHLGCCEQVTSYNSPLSPRDEFRSDMHIYEFRCQYVPHFISNSDTNTNIIKYKYKMDISNSDSHSNTYSIYSRVITNINFICRWFYN